MNICLSDTGQHAFLVAGTMIGYSAIAALAIYVGVALLQRRRDALDRQTRIDGIEPPNWRASGDMHADDYYRHGGEL